MMPNGFPALANTDRFGNSWRGRCAIVVGLGKSGVAAARFLHAVGCRVRVTELHDSPTVRALANSLREAGIDAVEVGRHSQELLEGVDVMILSPGVPETVPLIQWAREREMPILSEIELAFQFCSAPVVAVTGTNGKSSATTLLQQVLSAAGRPAIACGNLGTPFCDIVPLLTPTMTVIVEVSSFQLLWCEQFRPAIGILLNLGTNHLDRHHDRASYIAAKARLFHRQTPQDYAVLHAGDPDIITLSQRIVAQHVWFGEGQDNAPRFRLDPATCRVLPANAQAILQAGRVLGVPDPLVYQVIREFRGLEHRLEYVATVHGIRFVNDAKSTTPESLLFALERCQGAVVPIIGGRDKGLDFQPLRTALAQERIRGVVLIGESRIQLRALLNGTIDWRECDSLDEALNEAFGLAQPGDTVLFSPACASFDMFRNFEERGQLYKQLVRQLLATQSPSTNGRHGGPA